MQITKPKLTLILSLVFVLALSQVTEAKGFTQVQREHVNLNRLIKKRAPALDVPIGAAPVPESSTTTTTSVATTPPASSTTTSTTTSTSTTSTSITSTTSTSSTTPISSTTSTTSTTETSTSTTPTSTSQTTSATASAATSTTAPATSETINASFLTTQSTGTRSVVVATRTATDSAASSTASVKVVTPGSISKTATTILIVIGASIAGVAIIWTGIRKWKFRKSADFEDRMQPIDWAPTNDDGDTGLPTHRRANSGASSFHSGAGHSDNGAARGMGAGGHGSEVDYDHPAALAIPDHDFTAGAPSLAPVGGYADLARGPSPQPQMQEYGGHNFAAAGHYDQYGGQAHGGAYAAHDDAYGGHDGAYDAYDYNTGHQDQHNANLRY